MADPKQLWSRVRVRVASNSRPRTWREHLAQLARKVADRLDGRQSLALEMASSPAVPPAIQDRCVVLGVDLMFRLLSDSARAEAQEQMLRHSRPHLYERDARP